MPRNISQKKPKPWYEFEIMNLPTREDPSNIFTIALSQFVEKYKLKNKKSFSSNHSFDFNWNKLFYSGTYN